MTKIYYASDLHIEFYEDEKEIKMFFPPHPEDILVLAGDVGNPQDESFKRFIEYCCLSYKHVIYTTGNHEYYSHDLSMDNIDDMIRELSNKYVNFYPLIDSYVKLGDITFIGGTLFTYFPEGKYNEAEKVMRDYRYYTPGESIQRHKNTVQFLDEKTNIGSEVGSDKYVVVTHHLPSYSGISMEHKGNPYNYLFANHLDSLLRRDNILAWICGHTHTQNIVGKLYINPFGYPGESTRVLRSITL